MDNDSRLRCSVCGSPVDGDGEICSECISTGRDKDLGEVSRRKFLTGSIVGVSGLIGVGYVGLLLKNLYPANEAKAVFQAVGDLGEFTDSYKLVVYTGDGFQDGVYVRQKAPGEIQAFDFHCAHLQCPVQWVDAVKEFQCPCHGSVYNQNGQHIAGPAPRGLYPHRWKVKNGKVFIGGQIG